MPTGYLVYSMGSNGTVFVKDKNGNMVLLHTCHWRDEETGEKNKVVLISFFSRCSCSFVVFIVVFVCLFCSN